MLKNNKNQNMKHKDNNLQIPITLLNLILRAKIKSEMMKSAVYARTCDSDAEDNKHGVTRRNFG
jgi:hypothetical protein